MSRLYVPRVQMPTMIASCLAALTLQNFGAAAAAPDLNLVAKTGGETVDKTAPQSSKNSPAKFAADLAIPYSPKLIKGKLANGLTYYIQKNTKPEQKVEMRLVVNAGSVLEDEDQQGLAHFTEHMAFNGSRHFKKNELVSFLESIGVKFGADLNAYTGFDETVYILPIPTDKPDNFEKGMMVLADWASGLRFDAEEIEKERGVVLEEARLGKGAGERLRQQTLPKILHGSKYADRLPIGKEETIKTFKHEALKRFYADWYRPDLMAVVIVGDIDPKKAQTLVEKHFAGLKNPSKKRPRTIETLPLQNLDDALVAVDKEANLASVNISQTRLLQKNDGKFGSYRQRRIDHFINVMLAERLRELSQSANPPFLGASSGIGGLVGDYQEVSAGATIGKAGVRAAIEALVSENKRAAQFGFTAAELQRAKANSLRNIENSYNERDKTQSASLAAEFIRNFLQGEAIPGIEAEYVFHKEIVNSITLDEVNRYAKRILTTDVPELVIYQGSDKPDHALPDEASLKFMVKHAEALEVTQREEKVLSTDLFPESPKAGKVLNSTTDPVLGTTTWTLSNGVKVVLKKTDFKSDQILLSATRAGGTAIFSDEDYLQARYATSVVGAMGIKDLSPSEVTKVLAGKIANVSTSFAENSEGVSGNSNNNDVESMLQVLHLVLTQPRRDEELFKSFVNRQTEALKNQMASPSAIFQEQFLKATFPPHPRAPSMAKPEQIAKLDLDRMMAIYRQRFSSATGYTFFIVGSFDTEKLKPLVETYLASLPTPELKLEVIDHGVRPNKGVTMPDAFAGKEAHSLVSLQFHGETAMTPKQRMQFSAMGEVLQLRMTAKMREELGAVYSPNISRSLRRQPYQGYAVILTLPCGPENVDKLIASSFELIAGMKAAPPTEEELNKVKENWLKNYRESMKTNQFWMTSLRNANQLGDDPRELLSFEERVKKLTAQEVQAAAQAYLDTSNYIQVVLYPENYRAIGTGKK
ncbi:MAG: insulinase family protein [Burkholderiaceae bacterium]|nr:MAG: insulinase family protein [Burkholderiaceae bacterium]